LAAGETALRQKTEEGSFLSFFRGNIAVLALTSAIRSLGGFVSVYLPTYFVQIGGNPITLGLLGSAVALIQFLLLPIGGFLADYYGRRRVVVWTSLYGLLFPLIYGLVRDWRVFGALTILATFSVVSSPAVHATVADSIPPKKRTTGIAYLQVISSLPMAVAPLIGGWLIQIYGMEEGFRIGCLYAGGLGFIAFVPTLIFLRETLQRRIADKSDPRLRDVFMSMVRFSGEALPSSLKVLMFSYALVIFANNAVGQYYILFATEIAGLRPSDWGLIVSLQVVLASCLKIPGGWFSDRFGKRRVMIFSLLVTAPTILFFTFSRSFVQILVAALLLIVAGIYYAPAYEAFQADLTPRADRGRITALWDMSNAVSVASGALVGGLTFQILGPSVPFYIFAVAELAAATLMIKIVKEPDTKEA
jgi:MFS family permease